MEATRCTEREENDNVEPDAYLEGLIEKGQLGRVSVCARACVRDPHRCSRGGRSGCPCDPQRDVSSVRGQRSGIRVDALTEIRRRNKQPQSSSGR